MVHFPKLRIGTWVNEKDNSKTSIIVKYQSLSHGVVVPTGIWYHLAINIDKGRLSLGEQGEG